ncbi:MFS transporter [Streptomyces sp. NPDC004752]
MAFVFICCGAVFADWVPRLPQIKHALELSDGQLGLVLVGTPVGTLCAVRLASWGIARWGNRRVLRGGAVMTAAALPLPALAWNLETLAAGLFLLGCVLGVTEVAMNAQGVAVERLTGQPVMSGLHGAYSVGGLLGALLGSAAAHLGIPPLTHLAAVAVAIGAAVWVTSGALLDAEEPLSGTDTGAGQGRWTAAIVLLGAIALCSFVGEGAVENWSTVYLRDSLGASPGAAGLGYAGCMAAMTVVRLCGDRLVLRLGPVLVLRVGSLMAATALTAGIVLGGQEAAIAGFTLFGAGVALIAPVAFSAAGNLPGIPSAVAISRVTGIGYLAFVAGPPLIGFAADGIGLRKAMLIPAALAVVIGMLAGGARSGSGSVGKDAGSVREP